MTRPLLKRRNLNRDNIPKMVHTEMKGLSSESQETIGPIVSDLLSINDHPLVLDAERLAGLGIDDVGIARAWDISIQDLNALRAEFQDLDRAIMRGTTKFATEREEELNDPYASHITAEDLENLDTDKLKDGMFKGIYALEAALFGQAGFEANRVQRLRKTIATLETDILNPEELALLSKTERMTFYNEMNRTMRHSMNFLSKLHDSVTSGLEAVSSVERHRTSKQPASSVGTTLEREQQADLKQALLRKIKERSTNQIAGGE